MTDIDLQASVGDPLDHIRQDRLNKLMRFLPAYGLPLPTVTKTGDVVTLTWTPDLTAQEETNVRRLIRLTGALRMTPSELADIEDDVQVGIQYVQEPSPTAAQTVTSVKALWRVMAAILKE